MYEKRIESCANRIRIALTSRGMKQVELCQRANVPESSLSLYLKGAYEPKQDRIYNMASVLNVNEAWLMGYDVPMERTPIKKSNTIEVTEDEQKLLELFRLVPENQQQLVLQMIRVALDNNK